MMEMQGERLIPASRETVWAALNDAAMLQQCIPGCESIEQVSPTQMKAVAKVKIGPMSARFGGDVTLADIDAPHGYTISGAGQGGAAGFAKGGAAVQLVEQPGGTLLSYQVKAQVGGKMAQIGARLIDATAKSLADQFFSRLADALTPVEEEPIKPSAASPSVVGRQVAAIKGLFSRKDSVAGVAAPEPHD